MTGKEIKIIKEKQVFIEDGFELTNPSKYCISVELGTTHLNYAVFDPVSRFLKICGKIIFEFNEKKDAYAALFSDIVSETGVIQSGYHAAYVTWNKPGATLVPLSFYSENNKSQLLSFNNSDSGHGKILSDDVRGSDIKVIYSIPEPIKIFFDTHLSNHRLKHISTSLLEGQFIQHPRNQERKVFLNINAGNFNLLLIDQRGLRFFNTFDYQNTEDIIYYTLFAMEQNQFDVQKDKVIVAGEIEAGSGSHQLLDNYIQHLEFAVSDKSIIRGNGMLQMPHHFFYNTLNRFVCG